MSTEVYERVSSHIARELESGARLRRKPWNAASARERITHGLPGTSRADVKDVNDAAA
jgi:antirestriction protein ArdC